MRAFDPRDYVLLIVDDDRADAELLQRRLERVGYHVVTVESGREALEVLQRLEIHLVILDVVMPEMSGFEVLQAIRNGATDLPVIMATAKDDSAAVVSALGLGADDYVTKPIDFPLLRARIGVVLRTRMLMADRLN